MHLRKFPIELQAGVFTLEGWDRSFPSMRELRAALQGCCLRAGADCFALRRCCLPRPGGTIWGALDGVRVGVGTLIPNPGQPSVTAPRPSRDLQPHRHAGVSGQRRSAQPQPAQLPPDQPG